MLDCQLILEQLQAPTSGHHVTQIDSQRLQLRDLQLLMERAMSEMFLNLFQMPLTRTEKTKSTHIQYLCQFVCMNLIYTRQAT